MDRFRAPSRFSPSVFLIAFLMAIRAHSGPDSGRGVLDFVRLTDFFAGESTYDKAFEKAIAAAAVRTGVEIPNKESRVSNAVFVPAGTFPVRGPILVRDGVRLFGASRGASILRFQGGEGPAMVLGGSPLSPSGGELAQAEYANIVLENLAIVGDGRKGSIGVRFAGCNRGSYIQECEISRFDVNVRGEGSYGFEIRNNFIHNAKTSNIHWSSPAASAILGNRIDDAGREGVLIDDQAGSEVVALSISRNIIQTCRRNALKVEDAVQVSVDDNFFEANCLDMEGCAHVLFAPSSEAQPKKSLSIRFQGNFFTPGPASKHFPRKAKNRSIEVRSARSVSLVGVVARGFQHRDSATGSTSGVRLGDPANTAMKVDRVHSRGSSFNGNPSPIPSADTSIQADIR